MSRIDTYAPPKLPDTAQPRPTIGRLTADATWRLERQFMQQEFTDITMSVILAGAEAGANAMPPGLDGLAGQLGLSATLARPPGPVSMQSNGCVVIDAPAHRYKLHRILFLPLSFAQFEPPVVHPERALAALFAQHRHSVCEFDWNGAEI